MFSGPTGLSCVATVSAMIASFALRAASTTLGMSLLPGIIAAVVPPTVRFMGFVCVVLDDDVVDPLMILIDLISRGVDG